MDLKRVDAMKQEKQKRNQKMVALRLKGYSYNEIAKQFGVTRQRAYTVVKREMEKPDMDWATAEQQVDRRARIEQQEKHETMALVAASDQYKEVVDRYCDGLADMRDVKRQAARLSLNALALAKAEGMA